MPTYSPPDYTMITNKNARYPDAQNGAGQMRPTSIETAEIERWVPSIPADTVRRTCRILIVDDHPLFREGAKTMLKHGFKDGMIVEVNCAEEAYQQIEKKQWDLVLMDVNLPGRSGLDVLLDIRNAHPDLPVLLMSGDFNTDLALRALRSGAKGFLSKTSAADNLIDAVNTILSGKTFVSPDMAGQIAINIGTGGDQPPHESLSNREREVLGRIAAAQSPSEIAARLSLSVKTISTYRMRILLKLKLKSTAELMRYAIKHGLFA